MTIRIVIADDEPNQLELLTFNLTHAGFVVAAASDGQQALELIEQEAPDLIIIDWMMPHISGMELCRILRSRRETKQLPIIMLSARGEEGDRTLGLDTGADDYIAKPFSPRELVSRVKALLRRARPALMSDSLECGDVQLFPAKKEVLRAGLPVTLGPKEFQLLIVLLERPGRVVSRTQLLDAVWGHGVDVEERTVDVHVSRLRKAINNPPGAAAELPNIIRSVRGSGYVVRPDPQ